MKILVEVSARHVHLSKDIFDVLFGNNYQLSVKKNLSQPGQFLCNEKVTIVGPKSSISNVSVLGPLREKTQVEISLTDGRKLGIVTEIRESGNVLGTPGCKIIGPKSEVVIGEGVIVAKRHIHMTPEDAKSFGVKDGENVCVSIESSERPVLFCNTVVRVSQTYSLSMHIDTDEANAAAVNGISYGIISRNKD